ncbi:hypothetical protein E3V33_05365 [Candidatus Marinimicrobia bacterium MT.SAG.4]|nr:hypothetical protein E3V33_05365 [Candidatus Marinimicrobia bacterium MT.SAG.4]
MGWIVGGSGTILKTTDGGNTGALSSVYFADVATGWLVGVGGIILHTTDGGGQLRGHSGLYTKILGLTSLTGDFYN